MKTSRPKGAKAKADRLFSQLIRSRGYCERCRELGYAQRGPLQTAHIISRRFSGTRTDEENAWCLCAGCHLDCTLFAGLHMAFVEMTIGEDAYWRLYHKAHDFQGKFDWTAEAERLAALVKEAA